MKKESTYYNTGDKIILQKTTEAAGFACGYDTEVEIDYVFKNTPGTVKKTDSAKKLSDEIKNLKPEDAVMFYEKIYRLKSVTTYRMNEYRADEDWKLYTHVSKYLLPPLEDFTSLLEAAVLKNVTDYGNKISERKKIIDQQVKAELD